MNRLILAATIAALSQFSHAVCSYPLDATGAQYTQMQYQSFSVVNGQSVSNVITSAYAGPMALSSAGATDVLDSATTGADGGDITLPASGITAVEFSVDQFPQWPISSVGGVALSIVIASSNGTSSAIPGDGFIFSMMVVDEPSGNGRLGTAVSVFSATRSGSSQAASAMPPSIPIVLPLPSGYRFGLYMNMTTRQVGYTVNGFDYGYITQDSNGQPFTIPTGVTKVAVGISGMASVSATDPNIGATIGGTLITDSSQFTQPFPAGTTDMCGAAMVQASQVVASSTNSTTDTASASTSSGAGSADAFSLLLLLLLPARLCRRLA